MAIYLAGVDMPKENEFIHIRIYGDGDVTIELEDHYEEAIGQAVEVPEEHGDLIDREKASSRFEKLAILFKEKDCYLKGVPYAMAALFLNNEEEFPTVIPSSKEET